MSDQKFEIRRGSEIIPCIDLSGLRCGDLWRDTRRSGDESSQWWYCVAPIESADGTRRFVRAFGPLQKVEPQTVVQIVD